ncbi:MAG: hypothetical protein LBR08_07695 [Bacteroidales bacterium]|jgi:hypothetical protein|nr:hypothetical protein [Bacteroidales bacterium]
MKKLFLSSFFLFSSLSFAGKVDHAGIVTCRDQPGSLRVLTDAGKTTVSRYWYDAWGERKRVAGADITMRGFTGHEHLPALEVAVMEVETVCGKNSYRNLPMKRLT